MSDNQVLVDDSTVGSSGVDDYIRAQKVLADERGKSNAAQEEARRKVAEDEAAFIESPEGQKQHHFSVIELLLRYVQKHGDPQEHDHASVLLANHLKPQKVAKDKAARELALKNVDDRAGLERAELGTIGEAGYESDQERVDREAAAEKARIALAEDPLLVGGVKP